jgi:hypothetical protein
MQDQKNNMNIWVMIHDTCICYKDCDLPSQYRDATFPSLSHNYQCLICSAHKATVKALAWNLGQPSILTSGGSLEMDVTLLELQHRAVFEHH